MRGRTEAGRAGGLRVAGRPGSEIRAGGAAAGAGLGTAGSRIGAGESRPGLMGSVADGARESGSRIIGVVPVGRAAAPDLHPDLEVTVAAESTAGRRIRTYGVPDVCVAHPGAVGIPEEVPGTLAGSGFGPRCLPVVVVDLDRYRARCRKCWNAWSSRAFSPTFRMEP